MDSQQASPTNHAILIGINSYKGKSLRGSVRDVQDIKAYLEVAIDRVHIRMFTATESTNPESSCPVEDPQFLPTSRNINAAFEEVTKSAKAGDFVYIHYSGHGTREIPNDRSYNKSEGDLALVVLTEEKEKPETYLYGRSLAYSLNAMVKNGLVVTLVLDCCFSASVHRHEFLSVRYIPYDMEIGSMIPFDFKGSLNDIQANKPASRDASMLPNWLIDPDKYAILVACGPGEEAGESQFVDEQIHGLLSYFLLESLKEDHSLNHSINDIYERLRAEFRKYYPHQNPILYGNKGQGFLGHANLGVGVATVIINKKTDGSLELQAGLAQGVSNGDQFALCPLTYSESTLPAGDRIVTVKRAGAFTSDLERLDLPSMQDQPRWRARAVTQRFLRDFPIRLAPELLYFDEWLAALEKRSLNVRTDTEQRPSAFQVTQNSNQEYEVRDESSGGIIDLPASQQNQASISQIADILEHLARFKLARDLENKASTEVFQRSFDIHVLSKENRFDPGNLIEVNDGTKMQLVVRNRGVHDLYICIYGLGPCWQVENIYRVTHTAIPPESERLEGGFRKRLKMLIPRELKEKGYRSCEDIIKVFVTSHPTSFDFLELPRLGEPARACETDRTGHGKSDVSEDWMAVRFPIRTFVRADTNP